MGVNRIDDFSKILEIKRYSKNTVSSYVSFLRLFAALFEIKKWSALKDRDILNYCYQFIVYKELSYSSQKQLLSAIKLFYFEVFKRNLNLDSLRPKSKPKSNPVILSENEVRKLLLSIDNLKHKAMLATVYSLGLRSGELIRLKIKDFDGGRGLIYIRKSKGDKDRVLMFPENLKVMLRAYYIEYRPKEYLFEGKGGGMYSQSSLQKVLKKYLKISRINKSITLHGLRHSFATHLLEKGVSLAHIQNLLGHSNIKTTMIYTHVAKSSILKINSPIDDFEL